MTKRHEEASSLDDSPAPAKVWARHLGPLLRVWLHWKRGSLDQDGPEAVAHLSLGGGHWNVAVGDLSVLSQGASPGSDLKEEWKKLQQLSGLGASMARALCRLTGPFVVPRKRNGPGDVRCHSQTYGTAQGLKSDAMDRLLALKGSALFLLAPGCGPADQECSAQHCIGFSWEELKTEVFRRSSRLPCPSSTWQLGS